MHLQPSSQPDDWALAIVQQWLHERGWNNALAALERDAGVKHVEEKLARGSQLMELVYRHIEDQLAASLNEGLVLAEQRREALLRPGAHDYPCVLLHTMPLPQSNVLCVACLPSLELAVAGCADGALRVVSYDGRLVRELRVASSGVLCVAAAPGPDGVPSPLLAAGCMDGSVAVADAGTGRVLHMLPRAHAKYVVAAQWAGDGEHLVTGSWDESFAIHRWQPRAGEGPGSSDASAGLSSRADGAGTAGSSGSADDDGGGELVSLQKEQVLGQVTALLFLPNGASFLIAVRNSNYLRQYRLASSASAPAAASSASAPAAAASGAAASPGGVQTLPEAEGGSGAVPEPAAAEERRLNMNASGDDHVSFSAMHLALSPCGAFLLVSADNGRLIIWELEAWSQVRNLYGLPTEQFHQFAAAFSASGRYIVAAAALGAVLVYEVASAKVVATLRAHPGKNVRGLALDGTSNRLFTVSFDRMLKVWGPRGEERRASAEEGGS